VKKEKNGLLRGVKPKGSRESLHGQEEIPVSVIPEEGKGKPRTNVSKTEGNLA